MPGIEHFDKKHYDNEERDILYTPNTAGLLNDFIIFKSWRDIFRADASHGRHCKRAALGHAYNALLREDV